MEANTLKQTQNQKERIVGFTYVSLLFILTTALCCVCIFYYNFETKTTSQKEFAISKMDRIRAFQKLQSDEIIIVDSIYNKIKDFNPGISASYEENDIKFYLNDIKGITEKNSYDTRYKVFAQVSNFYNLWFADKKEVWTKRQNIAVFTKNLESCEIGLQKKKDELNNTKK